MRSRCVLFAHNFHTTTRLRFADTRRLASTTSNPVLISAQRHDETDASRPTLGSPDAQRGVEDRGLLRAILRECTYLPDLQSRQYLSQYALARFRTYGYKAWKHRDDDTFGARLQRQRRKARQAFYQLRRANEGDRRPLLKALFMTYGRIGKRRIELMRPLMPAAGREAIERIMAGDEERTHVEAIVDTEPAKIRGGAQPFRSTKGNDDAENMATVQTSGVALQEARDELPCLSPELYALALSQSQSDIDGRPLLKPQRLKPQIPELNSHFRPMPKSRVKNMTKKWYADILGRIRPPLPDEQWTALYDLACGIGIPQHPSPPRRFSAQCVRSRHAAAETSALEMVVTRGMSMADKARLGNVRRRTITPRFMQHLYVEVLGQCPRIDWNLKEKTWNVRWGHHELHAGFRANGIQRPSRSNAE